VQISALLMTPVGRLRKPHLLPLRADPLAVTDDRHSDHELRINRWPPELAVEGLELAAKIRQDDRHNRIDPAQQMARWNPPLEIEQIKQLALITRLLPHHAESPVLVPSQHRIILSRALPAGFSTVSVRSGHFNLLHPHSFRRSKFDHGDKGNQNKNGQHGGLRDREGWLSLRRSQSTESRNFHEALHD
jgi:hypothetical protein